MECRILGKEITDEECANTIIEAYKDKNGRELEKRVKRIIGWKLICKSCKNHVKP